MKKETSMEEFEKMYNEKDIDGLVNVIANETDTPLYAADLIMRINDKRAVEPLIDILNDESLNIHNRDIAAMALGPLGDSKAVEPLLKHINNPNFDLRDDIVNSLIELKDPISVDPLIKLLDDPYGHLRARAAHALLIIGDKRALEPLKKLFKDKDNNFPDYDGIGVDKDYIEELNQAFDEFEINPREMKNLEW